MKALLLILTLTFSTSAMANSLSEVCRNNAIQALNNVIKALGHDYGVDEIYDDSELKKDQNDLLTMKVYASFREQNTELKKAIPGAHARVSMVVSNNTCLVSHIDYLTGAYLDIQIEKKQPKVRDW